MLLRRSLADSEQAPVKVKPSKNRRTAGTNRNWRSVIKCTSAKMKIFVYVTGDLGDYFDPDLRFPSFSVDIPDLELHTNGAALLEDMQVRIKWLKDYWCT